MAGWGDGMRGWQRARGRERLNDGFLRGPAGASRWTALDLAAVVVGFAIRWELGVAFLALKLWQQATGHPGSVFAFAGEKWEALVAAARSVLAGAALPSVSIGPRPSGDPVFDAWRRSELTRLDGERDRLRLAEREALAYRDDLLHARTREEFDLLAQLRDRQAGRPFRDQTPQ